MTSIHTFIASPTAALLAESLLHSLWQGIVVSALLMFALKFLTSAQCRWRYWLSTAALFFILFSWLVTFSILRQEPAGTPPASGVTSHIEKVTKVARSANASYSVEPSSPVSVINRPEITSPPTQKNNLNGLIILWLTGIALMLLRMFALLCGAARHRRKAIQITDARWTETFRNLCERMGIRQKISMMATTTLATPGVIGFLKPMLLVPASMMTTLPPAHIEAILAHELTHIRRWDYLVNLAQLFIETVLFFNPAVWWISRQIRIEREACCDRESIETTGCSIEYAKALTDEFARTASLNQPPLEPLAAHFSDNRPDSAVDRIKRIIHPRYKPGIKIGWARLSAITLLAALSLFTLSKAADATVDAVARIMTPKERIEKLQELYSRDFQEKLSPQAVREDPVKITVSGRFIIPEGDVIPKHPDLTVVSSKSYSSSYGGRANDDLSFSVEVQNRPDIRVASYVPGYAPFFSETIHPRNGHNIENINIELKRGFTSSIQIVNEEGKPLPALEIQWFYAVETGGNGWTGLCFPVKKTTDANGMVSIEDGSQHPVRISIKAKGFQPLENQAFTLEKSRPLVITLKNGLMHEFKVISGKTGQPVVGAEVFLRSKKRQTKNMRYGDPGILWGTTDENGALQIDTLEDDIAYGLSVKGDGYNRLLADDIFATNKVTNLTLVERSVMIRGRIIGDLSRLEKVPVENNNQFAVTYHTYATKGEAGKWFGGRQWIEGHKAPVEIKDGVGYFELYELRGDEITIQPNGTKKEVTLEFDPATEKTVTINIDDDRPVWKNGSRTIEFTFITPDNLPKAQGHCTAYYQSKEAGDRGSSGWSQMQVDISNGVGRASFPAPIYVMLGRGQGLAGYLAESEGYEAAHERLIEPGNTPYQLSYMLKPAGGISGILLDSGEQSLDDMKLDIRPILPLTPVEGKEHHSKAAKEAFRKERELMELLGYGSKRPKNGRFSYTSLPLDYTYRIIAHSGNTLLISDPVTITEQNPVQEITLEPVSLETVTRRVFMPDGSPAADIPVRFSAFAVINGVRHGFSAQRPRYFTDANGSIKFSGINAHPDLEYYISIDPGNEWQPIEEKVEPGSDQTYALEKGLVFNGKVIDQKTGSPLAGVLVGIGKLSDQAMLPMTGYNSTTDAEGRFSFSTLSPEPYGIGVYTATNRFEITSPATTNFYPTITGGVDEYVELTVKPMTNTPVFMP